MADAATKIHPGKDETGCVRTMVLTGGQTADVKVSPELLVQSAKAQKVIADKAYDADWLLHYLISESIEAVIPPKRSRLKKRTMDYKMYTQRKVTERTINKLKQYRKIATHDDKTAISFISLYASSMPLLSISIYRCQQPLIQKKSFYFDDYKT